MCGIWVADGTHQISTHNHHQHHPMVAPRLVYQHTSNQCQSVCSELASHQHLLQIACQAGASKGVQIELTDSDTVNQSCDWFWFNGWEVKDHPPCIPRCSPHDFHLSGHHKKHLVGNQFATDANMLQADTSWLQILA
jgi:hypothetical protein